MSIIDIIMILVRVNDDSKIVDFHCFELILKILQDELSILKNQLNMFKILSFRSILKCSFQS